MPTNSDSDAAADPAEALLAQCLARDEAEWEQALEAACAKHPEHAATLRRRFQRLLQTSAPLGHKALEVMPERLGEFRVLERLGGGGMGVVYRAEQESLKREVALKVIRPEHLWFQGARDRFRREVEAAARCQHPGIVPVYAVGESAGVPFFAMERVLGLSLGDVLVALEGRAPSGLGPRDLAGVLRAREVPGVPEPEACGATFGAHWVEICCRIVRQAAQALAHAHERGVLHRDLKPSNLMLTGTGQVRLVDFGCAFAAGAERLTRTGTELGSLPYMAPEQLRGQAPDARTDVYSLGLTLYELLTLTTAYLDADLETTRRRILDGRPRPPRTLNPSVPWDVETVCLVAMDREPKRRYPSMQELAADLTRVLEHRPITARRPGVALRARRFVQRHPALSVTLGLGSLLFVFGPLLLWLQARTHARELGGALANVERLADERVLEDLIKEEALLWPMTPDRVGGENGFDAWLATAKRLVARGAAHERDLEALRAKALPRSAEETAADAARKLREAEEYAHVKAQWDEIARDSSTWSTDAMAEVVRRYRALRFSVADRYTYRFARAEERWRHDKLVGLIAGIRELGASLVGEVTRRRDAALTLEKTSLEEAKELWARTQEELAAAPAYRGVALTPQLGLVPLGPDPLTGLFEFAHVQSGEVPRRHPRTGKLLPSDNPGLVFVLLPGGKTSIGQVLDAGGEHDDDGPPVEVELAPFFVSKHEMTQGQWWNCFHADVSTTRVNRLIAGAYVTYQHPVESVSWPDADLAMRRLELTLPTEAQWEYAARAGTVTPWPNAHDAADVEGFANLRAGDRWPETAPVGSFLPNAFGLGDVIGNVAEWCRDRYEPFAVAPRAGDGLRVAGGSSLRVLRGGGYLDAPSEARVAARRREPEGNRFPWAGLRPARALLPARNSTAQR